MRVLETLHANRPGHVEKLPSETNENGGEEMTSETGEMWNSIRSERARSQSEYDARQCTGAAAARRALFGDAGLVWLHRRRTIPARPMPRGRRRIFHEADAGAAKIGHAADPGGPDGEGVSR